MQGRFANLYAIWAHRHETLQTPLAILENTEESCLTMIVSFFFKNIFLKTISTNTYMYIYIYISNIYVYIYM